VTYCNHNDIHVDSHIMMCNVHNRILSMNVTDRQGHNHLD